MILILLLCVLSFPLYSYKILYAEQFYRLFHMQFYQYPENINENIWYLEKALRSDFCNPLNALARIENKQEWAKYRKLFYMHVNLKILEQYRLLASKYDKQVAYFYNAPWQETNLKSLQLAELNYEKALYYWEEAQKWAFQASGSPIFLEEIQQWEDERYRIVNQDLDYRKILLKDLARLEQVRRDFENMDENTY